ncbi:hypothetical protein [Rhizobium lusitanum]|uniref:hypothetical protein n=1 Tax=Rhizobium lusitanum TaxID=293958 RepID=UPI00195773B1|nr:hypothetical protein [Rhizobium lusitanum]MBM7049223.1 hypothetical protein [Rhizobium lusitanum]
MVRVLKQCGYTAAGMFLETKPDYTNETNLTNPIALPKAKPILHKRRSTGSWESRLKSVSPFHRVNFEKEIDDNRYRMQHFKALSPFFIQ